MPKPNVSVTHNSRFKQVSDRLNQLSHTDVLIGIPASENQRKSDPSLNNAALMFIMERGSEPQHIPPRPVLAPSIEQNKALITPPLRSAVQHAMAGEPYRQDLENAGTIAANGAKRFISDPGNGLAPNSPATIKAKGSDKPLIDTGELRRAITWVIQEGQQ
jgi:hypothetical protein